MGEQTSCTFNTIKKRLSLCLSWWCRWLQHCSAQGTWRLGSSEENPNLSAHHRKGLSSSWRRPSIINNMQRFYCFVRLIRAVAVHSHSKSMSEAASRPPPCIILLIVQEITTSRNAFRCTWFWATDNRFSQSASPFLPLWTPYRLQRVSFASSPGRSTGSMRESISCSWSVPSSCRKTPDS